MAPPASRPPATGFVVVRFGPLATEFAAWRDRAAAEVAQLQAAGKRVVVVHAGGPRVDEFLARLGRRPTFQRGHPVVDDATFETTEMVASAVGKDLVAALQRRGCRALGLSGRDGALLLARRAPDHGAAGEVAATDVGSLVELAADGFLPVVTAIGTDEEGRGVVLRADDVAASLAAALRAETLVFLDTDDGVQVHGQRVPRLGSHRAGLLLAQGEVPAQLAPTLAACARAVEGGAALARIVDVRQPGALARAAEADADVGTAIRAQSQREAVQALPRA